MNVWYIISQTAIEISPAIIAVASLIALTQIAIAKNDIKIRAKREAVTLAADKCSKVARELLPMSMNNFINSENKFILKKWELKNYAFDSTSLKDPNEGDKWVKDIRDKGNYIKCLDFLNEIEAISMYFAHGAADENIAYPVIGPLLCEWIIMFSPLLIKLREKTIKTTTSGPYQNTIDLFCIWILRLNKDKLQEEHDTLHERLNSAGQKSIKPIGA